MLISSTVISLDLLALLQDPPHPLFQALFGRGHRVVPSPNPITGVLVVQVILDVCPVLLFVELSGGVGVGAWVVRIDVSGAAGDDRVIVSWLVVLVAGWGVIGIFLWFHEGGGWVVQVGRDVAVLEFSECFREGG